MPRKPKKTDSSPQRGIGAEFDRLKTILDSIDDWIYIVDKEYCIRFMNRAFRNEFGEGDGHRCYDFFNHEISKCEECQLGMSSFGPQIRRESFLSKTQRFYDVVISPIHEPDGSISRLHILRDITDRKRLEDALQEYSKTLEAKVAEQSERLMRQERLALLGEIWAGLAHELRTPLGAIMTGIRLLEDSCPSGEEKALFELLKNETIRLKRKLSQFLNYARPRSPSPADVQIDKFLAELQSLLMTDKELIRKVKVKLKIDPDLTVWPLDHDQTREALLNICINALQSLDGEGILILEAKTGGDSLDLIVRDNGPGIPLNELPHIFKPFYSRKPGGSGLGLAISRQMIETQGGRVSVASIPGLNTTFRISIPRTRSKDRYIP